MDDRSLRSLTEKIKNHAEISDREDLFPAQEFEWIRQAGLLNMPLCRTTMDFRNDQSAFLVHVLQMLGAVSLPVARIFEGHVNALQLISLYADPAQKAKYFSEVFDRQFLFGVWNTQDADGVSIIEIGGGKYRLRGSKSFCSGAGWIQRPLITGELVSAKAKGWQMCIIPHEKITSILADGTQWKPLGMRTSASFRMDFTGIVVDQKDLLGPAGAYYQQPYFSGGAFRFAAVQLGAAQAILKETHDFLRTSGRTDDAFQKARVAEIACLVETGNLWVKQAAILTDAWHKSADAKEKLLAYVNMTRTVVQEICIKCMDLAERSVGVRGLMQPHALERIHRDLTTYLKQPAPDAAILSVGQYVLGQKDLSSLWTGY